MAKNKATYGMMISSLVLVMIFLFCEPTPVLGNTAPEKSSADKTVPATFVSTDPKEWNGRWERGDTFRMTTELRLPDDVSAREGSASPVPRRVVFLFDAVSACNASLSDDGRTLTIEGRVFNSSNARDVVLRSVGLEYPDGTVYRQDGIGVRLTETKDYYYYDENGGCNVAGCGTATLALSIFFLIRRRRTAA